MSAMCAFEAFRTSFFQQKFMRKWKSAKNKRKRRKRRNERKRQKKKQLKERNERKSADFPLLLLIGKKYSRSMVLENY
jgi:hypothetical protein